MSNPLNQSEKTVEKDCVKYAKSLGWMFRKQQGQGQRGKTDRFFMKNGITVFVEFKRPGEKPTPKQANEIEMLREEGFQAEWFDSIGDFNGVIGVLQTVMSLHVCLQPRQMFSDDSLGFHLKLVVECGLNGEAGGVEDILSVFSHQILPHRFREVSPRSDRGLGGMNLERKSFEAIGNPS